MHWAALALPLGGCAARARRTALRLGWWPIRLPTPALLPDTWHSDGLRATLLDVCIYHYIVRTHIYIYIWLNPETGLAGIAPLPLAHC